MTSQDATTTTSGKITQIDEGLVKRHLSEIVRGSVEETEVVNEFETAFT